MQQRPGQRTPIINDDVRRLAAFFAADPPFYFARARTLHQLRGVVENYMPGDIRQWYNRQDETTKERFIRGVLLETQRQSDAKHTGLFTHLWDAFVRPETLHPEYDRTQPVLGARYTKNTPDGRERKLKPGEPGRGGVREVGAFEAFANITTTPLRVVNAIVLSHPLFKGRTFGRESGTPTKAGSFAENYAADPSWGSVIEAAVPQMHPFARMVLGGVLNMIVDPSNLMFAPAGVFRRVTSLGRNTTRTATRTATRTSRSAPGTMRVVIRQPTPQEAEQAAEAVIEIGRRAANQQSPLMQLVDKYWNIPRYWVNRVLEYDPIVEFRRRDVPSVPMQELEEAVDEIIGDPRKYATPDLRVREIQRFKSSLKHAGDLLPDDVVARRERLEDFVSRSKHPVAERIRATRAMQRETPVWEEINRIFDEGVTDDPKYAHLKRWFVNEFYRRFVRDPKPDDSSMLRFADDLYDKMVKEAPDLANKAMSLEYPSPQLGIPAFLWRERLEKTLARAKQLADRRAQLVKETQNPLTNAVRFWKLSKTAFNFPASTIRNFFQNFPYRYITGDVSPYEFGRALGRLFVYFISPQKRKSWVSPVEVMRELRKQGKATDIDTAAALARRSTPQADTPPRTALERAARLWGAVRDAATDFYGSADLAAATVMAYGKADPKGARELVDTAVALVPDYTKSPMLVQRLAQYGILPFGNWLWYALSGTARGIKQEPSRLGKLLDAMYGAGFEMDVGKRDPDNPVLSDRIPIPTTNKETRGDIVAPFEIGAGTDIPLWSLEQMPITSLYASYRRAAEGETNPLRQFGIAVAQAFSPPTLAYYLPRAILPEEPRYGERRPLTREDALISLFGLPLRPRDPFAEFGRDLREWRSRMRRQMQDGSN